MPITVTPTITVDPVQLTKFRELSADSILYLRIGHTADLPKQITVTSDLPVPRKGNPGTVKTTINSRYSAVLDKGEPTERVVPVICKIMTSYPVGTSLADRREAVRGAIALAMTDDAIFDELFYTGILPND